MSVTFYSMEAPKKVVSKYECQCAGQGEEPYSKCSLCDGTGEVVVKERAFSVHMSNANARDVLKALGLPIDDPLVGGWETPEQRSEVMQRLIKVLHSPLNDKALEKGKETPKIQIKDEDGVPTIKRGPTVYRTGRKEGYIREKLEQIQELLHEAIKRDWTVTWS